MGQSDAHPTGDSKVTAQVQQFSFVEIVHEIFSSVILSLPPIQEGQFLVKECAQVLVNHLND